VGGGEKPVSENAVSLDLGAVAVEMNRGGSKKLKSEVT
jgi:hypothetical protein